MIEDKDNEIGKMELLRGLIEYGMPVFIHNKMRNVSIQKKLFPDSMVFSSTLLNLKDYDFDLMLFFKNNTLRSFYIKPYWLKKLEAKCNNYPDSLFILLIDDLSNSLIGFKTKPIAKFNRVDGKWNLPKNLRVVTIDEDNKYLKDQSISKKSGFFHIDIGYNDFLEPLFTNSIDESNSIQDKKIIHPFLITYLAYKGYDFNEVITPYNDYHHLSIWEKASDQLYRSCYSDSLTPLLGDSITKDFVEYCGQDFILEKKIINGNYTDEAIEGLTTKQKYLLIAFLCGVADEDLEKTRRFISKMGKDMLDLFDAVYTDNYKEVMEIAEKIRKDESESVFTEFLRKEYQIYDNNSGNVEKLKDTNLTSEGYLGEMYFDEDLEENRIINKK